MDVLVVKYNVRTKRKYYPGKYDNTLHCKVFIDNKVVFDDMVVAYEKTTKRLIERLKKKFKFEEYKFEKWRTEYRDPSYI